MVVNENALLKKQIEELEQNEVCDFFFLFIYFFFFTSEEGRKEGREGKGGMVFSTNLLSKTKYSGAPLPRRLSGHETVVVITG